MLDIQNFAWRHFRDVRTYGSPISDLRVNCPFCDVRYGKVDVSYKLYISLNKRVCHCFRCGYSRSWLGLVMDVTGMDYAQSWGELYCVPKVRDFDNIHLTIAHTHDTKGSRISTKQLVLPPGWNGVVSGSREAQYLERRGFGPWHLDRYHIGTLMDHPGRVVIPMEKGFWQARAIYPFMKPKYISPNAQAYDVIFNAAALELYDEVAICEGAFSAMAVGENAVGLLRNKATSGQVDRFINSGVRKFIVVLDAGAERMAVALGRALMRGGKCAELRMCEIGDPADGGKFIVRRCDFAAEVKTMLGSVL